ncbi:hypothetical protein AAG570_007061 [Ranatra chinensis]|uniref:Uncharacterized protein n=1 Tax=Ranatra chinensis TaxID=642074 RepID=A0ABD0XXG1_9HEMI
MQTVVTCYATMAHMNTLRGIYSENLRGLICHITSHDRPREKGEVVVVAGGLQLSQEFGSGGTASAPADSPEVKRFEDTVISNVAYRSYPTVSKRSVLATIDGFVDKFRTHGFPGKASNLRKLADRYVQCDYFRKPIKVRLDLCRKA